MPKSKGPQTWPTGGRVPVEINEGMDQRHFNPGGPGSSSGAQTYPQGTRFGTPGPNDKQRAHSPGSVPSKGPQTQKSSKFGDMSNQNQDPQKPFNP
jgi:hypothetical protein